MLFKAATYFLGMVLVCIMFSGCLVEKKVNADGSTSTKIEAVAPNVTVIQERPKWVCPIIGYYTWGQPIYGLCHWE